MKLRKDIIYMDNASTTKPCESIVKNLPSLAQNFFANPSSLHGLGFEVEKEIKKTRKIISKELDVSTDEIFFTSGATESNNISILGTYNANKRNGNHIIISKTEHPSVFETVKRLELTGVEVTYLDVCKKGYINMEQLEKSIREDTILVSVMQVNNETGTIQDIEKISSIVKSKNVIMHCDGVQGFLKHKMNLKNIDLYTFSSHKVNGVKGVGGLYIKKGTKINPVMFGGEQEVGVRVGTENSLGIICFGIAVEEFVKSDSSQISRIKEKIMSIANNVNIYVNGDSINGSKYILNMSFLGVGSEIFMRTLEGKGIYVSSGTSCSAKKSHKMLTYHGYREERVNSALRFSFSSFNTLEEAEYCVRILENEFNILQKVKGRRK